MDRKAHTNAVIESLLAAKIAVFKVEVSDDPGESDSIYLVNGYRLGLDYGSVPPHGLVRVDLDKDSGGRKSDTLFSWEMPPMTLSTLVSNINHEFKGRVNLDEAWLLRGDKMTVISPAKEQVPDEFNPKTYSIEE
ncbi:MAG: hypothetical protein Q7U28_09195 [Aquabacterium sp.]|nr:hypothetical protein [Aquabacterium sp.]